jgi:hypothetical protein
VTAAPAEVEAEDTIAAHLWPANPKRYGTSRNPRGEAWVELSWENVDEILDAAYALMDVTTSAGDDQAADAAWWVLLNLLGHIQRWTVPEYWPALRAGKPGGDHA